MILGIIYKAFLRSGAGRASAMVVREDGRREYTYPTNWRLRLYHALRRLGLLVVLMALAPAAKAQCVDACIKPVKPASTSTVFTVQQGTVPWTISGSTVSISGSIALSTGANQIGTVSVSTVTAYQGGAPWSVSGPLTDMQLRAADVPVRISTGSVTAFPPSVASASNDGACISVTASTTLLSANAGRRFYTICARASNTDTVFVKLGTTATTADFPMEPGQCDNAPPNSVYTGIIDAIANSGTQSMCVRELQ